MKIAKPKIVRFGDAPTPAVPVGWVCPKCGHVWSPRTASCLDCNRSPFEVIR
jgi:uncharacterized OB-fold protein